MADKKPPRKPPVTSIINFSANEILRKAEGDVEKVVKSHATPAYLLVEELKGCPPDFPPKLGFLIPDAAEIWTKVWMRLGAIFNAYEDRLDDAKKKVDGTLSTLANLEKKYETDTSDLVKQHNEQFDLRETAEKALHDIDGKYKKEQSLARRLANEKQVVETERNVAVTGKNQVSRQLDSKVQELAAEMAAKQKIKNELAAKLQELTAAQAAKQRAESELAAKSHELAAAYSGKKQVEGDLAAKSQNHTATEAAKRKAENELAAKSQELAAKIAEKQKIEGELAAKSQELVAAYTGKQQAENNLAAKVQELTTSETSRQKTESELAVKTQELAAKIAEKQKVEGDLAAKSQNLTAVEAAKQKAENELVINVLELADAIAAKDTAERNFADLKPRFEKLQTDYAKVQSSFSAANAAAAELLGENSELYMQTDKLSGIIKKLEASLKFEKERADELNKIAGANETALSNVKSKVRIGWYAAAGSAAAAALLAVIAYISPAQPIQVAKIEQPPQVAKVDKPEQPPKVEIKPPVISPSLAEPRNESMRYLMGAYLLELPDNQFVISSKKDSELEKRAKSVRYLTSAYIVEFDNRQFALTDEVKSLLDKNMKNEKARLGRDLKNAEKKVLYEKFAAKYINQ